MSGRAKEPAERAGKLIVDQKGHLKSSAERRGQSTSKRMRCRHRCRPVRGTDNLPVSPGEVRRGLANQAHLKRAFSFRERTTTATLSGFNSDAIQQIHTLTKRSIVEAIA